MADDDDDDDEQGTVCCLVCVDRNASTSAAVGATVVGSTTTTTGSSTVPCCPSADLPFSSLLTSCFKISRKFISVASGTVALLEVDNDDVVGIEDAEDDEDDEDDDAAAYADDGREWWILSARYGAKNPSIRLNVRFMPSKYACFCICRLFI